MPRKWKLWLMTAVAFLTVGIAGVGGSTASAHSTRATGVPVVWSNSGNYVAGRYCANVQCAAQYWLKNGTAFHMSCYGDTVNQHVNYWSPRWFYGYFTLASGGWKYWTWVHSSQVYYQWSVPRC